MIRALALAATLALKPDPLSSQQWALRALDYDKVQSSIAEKARSPVVVAVIDSGLDLTHPEFEGRIEPGAYDFLNQTDKVFDDTGHGTHVSGIIAANSGNGTGIAGLTPPSVKILPLKVLAKNGFSNFVFRGKVLSDYVAEAVRYAVAHHAAVINLSLGWPKVVDNANARAAFEEALKAGVVIVAAAGNDRKDDPTYPCAYPGVICVGATNETGKLASFSNFGGEVDVLAPGESIVSTYPSTLESAILRLQGYDRMSGTSQASPMVAAAAAILKSLSPAMSTNEIRARLIYGFPSFRSVLEMKPRPAYWPEFKDQVHALIQESHLKLAGETRITNLWAPGQGVQVHITADGRHIGSASAVSLATGEQLAVQWEYPLESLDRSATLALRVEVIDSAGFRREFPLTLSLARSPLDMPTQKRLTFGEDNPALTRGWFSEANGHLFSNWKSLSTYAHPIGSPVFGRSLGVDEEGTTIQLLDPEASPPLQTVRVPNVQSVEQVLRIDLDQDGKLDWVITGVFPSGKERIFQFCFLDSSLRPKWSQGYLWQISLTATKLGHLLDRDYSKLGSWVRSGERLIPAFLSNGQLPADDNYGTLDYRHFSSSNHLYYLDPVAGAPSGPNQMLRLRALDSAARRGARGLYRLITPLAGTLQEQQSGHLRILVSSEATLDSAMSILDVQSVEDARWSAAPGWENLAASGQLIRVPGTESSGLVTFFDAQSGSVAWAGSDGSFQGRTEFKTDDSNDPLTGLKGAFDFGPQGKFLFLVTAQRLLLQHGSTLQSLPLNRDSSFPNQEFIDLLNPVTVGSATQPQPGIFVDSTLIQGDQVAVATWQQESGTFTKPLRYSFILPSNCVVMNPYQDKDRVFKLPVLCRLPNGAAELRSLQP